MIYVLNGSLAHHGVKGMHWGVRRYQNYDGTYTKKGMDHYKQSLSDYQKAKDLYKNAKNSKDGTAVSKKQLRNAKETYKLAKKNLNQNYKQLKQNYKADKGKELYKNNVRIRSNKSQVTMAALAVIGARHCANKLYDMGDMPAARVAAAATIGASAVYTALRIRNADRNSKLNAYYTYSPRYAKRIKRLQD